MLGPTLMPGRLVPGAYRRLCGRLGAPGSEVRFHAMPHRGGTGRTDLVVDHFRPLLAAARAEGRPVRLAGHSLGGVVAWALAHEYPDVIEEIELWCAPVRGTARGRTWAPVAEARFLAPESRWLAQYDLPLRGVRARSIFPASDVLATPAIESCAIEGEAAETHVVLSPEAPLPEVTSVLVHRGRGGHVTLPSRPWIHRRLDRLTRARRAAAVAA